MVSILIGLLSFIVYTCFQAQYIPGGDSGDLVTAAITLGVPHPPGYPLFTLLGWMLSLLPFQSPVWRVGLLSAIPHAITVGIVSSIVYRLTRHVPSAIFAGTMLAGNYLFFLYSVTPEVFALLDLFTVLLVWLIVTMNDRPITVTLFAVSFLIGISLTHHHVIVFLIPAIVWFLWGKRRYILYPPALLRAILLFMAGLFPYLYVPIAARGTSPINWDTATTISNFIRLITRADYGSFQSGVVYGSVPLQRLLQLKAYTEHLGMDFSWVGLACIGLGAYALFIRNRKLFWYLCISVMSIGPLFVFYASFPLANRFSLATYERFLLPSYSLLAIFFGMGVFQIFDWQRVFFRRNIDMSHLVRVGLIVLFCIMTVTMSSVTIWKFIGYNGDKTVTFLASDVLDSIPSGALLIMDRDTLLFSTQYLRYGERVRPDIILLHGLRLGDIGYQQSLNELYPTLSIPEPADVNFFDALLIQNYGTVEIFSYLPLSLEPAWTWVHHGLIYRLARVEDAPDTNDIIGVNTRLWEGYHDPGAGVLSRYNHLMLSDARDIFTTRRTEYGNMLLRLGKLELARDQFIKAISYGGDNHLSDAYKAKGISEMLLGNCDSALRDFDSATNIGFTPDHSLTLYRALTYKHCAHDATISARLYDEYERLEKTRQIELQSL